MQRVSVAADYFPTVDDGRLLTFYIFPALFSYFGEMVWYFIALQNHSACGQPLMLFDVAADRMPFIVWSERHGVNFIFVKNA